MAPNSGAGGIAYALEALTSTEYVDQEKAATGDDSEGIELESKDTLDGGSDTDRITGFSANLGPSGTCGDMGACLERNIVVVAEEVELQPSAAERLPSSTRLFVTVSAFFPVIPY